MADVAIKVVGLGKRYRLGRRQRYKALRDTLTDAMHVPVRLLHSAFRRGRSERTRAPTIWALKDVSLDVQQGEVVGVIGRNGAGKSTLLRILSRITEPTEGFVELFGRVGSLLEVGTGFHPELTGRENVYLNGSIIGMKKREVDQKFDQIVAFAELERFLDTPVKFYSSGMYMRLGFAVAAHLEPEILLVDEVLAVGDAAFQKKCLGKMSDVADAGRTVLFVSHNMGAIQALCQRCLVFDGGRLIMSGGSSECVGTYVHQFGATSETAVVTFPDGRNDGPSMRRAAVLCNDVPATTVLMGDSIAISVEFRSAEPLSRPRLGFVVSSHNGVQVLNANNRYQPSPAYAAPVRAGTIQCELGAVPLMPGRYTVSLYLGNQFQDTHVVHDALSFDVVERDLWGEGQMPPRAISSLWWPTTFTMLPARSPSAPSTPT
jgi:lipopolysaccharide transport system ATP-binding protein